MQVVQAASDAGDGKEPQRRAVDRLTRWIRFELDRQAYGVPVPAVREVVPLGEVAPIPGAPAEVCGVVNLRGQLVPVICLRRRLGLAERVPDDSTRVILVDDDDGGATGLRVDSVQQVIDVFDADIEPAPAVGSRRDHGIHGIARDELGPVTLLEIDALVQIGDAGVER